MPPTESPVNTTDRASARRRANPPRDDRARGQHVRGGESETERGRESQSRPAGIVSTRPIRTRDAAQIATPAATDQRASTRSITLATPSPAKPLTAKKIVGASEGREDGQPAFARQRLEQHRLVVEAEAGREHHHREQGSDDLPADGDAPHQRASRRESIGGRCNAPTLARSPVASDSRLPAASAPNTAQGLNDQASSSSRVTSHQAAAEPSTAATARRRQADQGVLGRECAQHIEAGRPDRLEQGRPHGRVAPNSRRPRPPASAGPRPP